MTKIEVYTTRICPYCVRAKQLLDRKGLAYVEIDVSDDPEGRMTMMKRAEGRRTVPQIFINNVGVGGCDDLYALDAAGRLDLMIKAA